ncbi:MAG: hypothetical protein M3Z20_05300 [Chloroflexota bacterium]|nr:hypothetical protein [Chloroflexota bacterium]
METFEDRVGAGVEHEDAALNRRHLLRVAGSRFALAASGLLLPAWLSQDAAARKGSAHGKLGGRRGENRRGRDTAKRRKRAQAREKRKDQAKAPGWSLIKYVSFRMEPTSALQDLRIDTYYRIKGELDTWSSLKPAQTFTSFSSQQTYAPERYSIAAFIQARDTTPIFIEARNPMVGTPWVTIAHGGRIDANGNYVGGAANWGINVLYRYSQYALGVNKSMNVAMTSGGGWPQYLANVERLDDTDTHKVFSIYLGRGSHEYDLCDYNVACWV